MLLSCRCVEQVQSPVSPRHMVFIFFTRLFYSWKKRFFPNQYLDGEVSCSARITAVLTGKLRNPTHLFENYAYPGRNNHSAIRSSALSTISNYRSSKNVHRPATTSSFSVLQPDNRFALTLSDVRRDESQYGSTTRVQSARRAKVVKRSGDWEKPGSRKQSQRRSCVPRKIQVIIARFGSGEVVL